MDREPKTSYQSEQSSAGSLSALDDVHLASLVRSGNESALGVLFSRYRGPGERLAVHLGMGAEAADVVSESFAQILDLLKRGKGPDRAFRAYVFTAIRHESGRRAKARARTVPTDDPDHLDSSVPFGDGQLDEFETGAVRRAYLSLPPRWRSVLWALDVEGRSVSEIGERAGMTPNAVSALVYRARAGLRESYLHEHAGANCVDDAACKSARKSMASAVRGRANQRTRDRVAAHIAGCSACARAHTELQEINRALGLVNLPAALSALGTISAVLALWAALASKVCSAVKDHLFLAVSSATAVGAAALAPLTFPTVVPQTHDVVAMQAHGGTAPSTAAAMPDPTRQTGHDRGPVATPATTTGPDTRSTPAVNPSPSGSTRSTNPPPHPSIATLNRSISNAMTAGTTTNPVTQRLIDQVGSLLGK